MNYPNLISPVRCISKFEFSAAVWIPFLVLVASITIVDSKRAVAADQLAGDLFSKITMSETTDSAISGKRTSDKNNEVLGVLSLSKVLSADQIKCDVQSQTVLVDLADLSTDATTDAGDGKLRLTVDAEAKRIDVFLSVRTVAGDATVSGAKLMRLIAMLSALSNVQLTASDESLSLHTSLSNQNVTPDRIRSTADRLVSAAKKAEPITSTIDDESSVATATPPSSVTSATPTTLTTATKPISIAGTWSAKTSTTDAWAMRLNSDNTFAMVHTRNGKNSVSRGSYRVDANRLIVQETDGVSLTGQLNRQSDKSFAWKLQDASGKTLTTLNFSKQ